MSLQKLRGLILGLCPRCLEGAVFVPGLKGVAGLMNNSCTLCRLPLMREAGYYLGAMYVSYALGLFTVLPVAVLLAVVLEWELWLVMVIMVVQTLVSMPIFFRYSRILWLYVDQAIDPQ
jgi:uncharacterized protein (DUF983 family)